MDVYKYYKKVSKCWTDLHLQMFNVLSYGCKNKAKNLHLILEFSLIGFNVDYYRAVYLKQFDYLRQTPINWQYQRELWRSAYEKMIPWTVTVVEIYEIDNYDFPSDSIFLLPRCVRQNIELHSPLDSTFVFSLVEIVSYLRSSID